MSTLLSNLTKLESIKSWIVKLVRRLLVQLVRIEELNSKTQNTLPLPIEKIPTPEALYLPFAKNVSYLNKKTYFPEPIYSTTLSHVIYCPKHEVLLTKSRKVIANSISTLKKTGEDVERFSITCLYFSPIERISGACSVFRSTSASVNYYHTLIDNIPRFFLLNQPGYENIGEIKLLMSSEPTNVEKFFIDKLLPKNFKITVLNSKKLYLCENLIFPTFLTQLENGALPKQYLEFLQEKVAPKRPRNKINRIFISRPKESNLIGRFILNEGELLNVLEKYGFKRYTLESMSLENQIELFYDAEYVIGVHGAGLANLVYSDQIKLIELFPTQIVTSHYYFLAKSTGSTYKYWCGIGENHHSNLEVDVTAVRKLLEELNITSTEVA